MRRYAWSGLTCYLLALTSCSSGKLERIPSIDFQTDFDTPADADIRIRSFALENGFVPRDTMKGIDGYTNYLVGKDGVIVTFIPSVDCPRPAPNEYWINVTITPEDPDGELLAVEKEAANLRREFGSRIVEEGQREPCPT